MRKYVEVTKLYMKQQLAWRADIFFNMFFTISKILFAYLLWSTIFRQRDMVGEFTFHGMLSYYIVSSFLSQLEMSQGVSAEIHERIRNGTFSKYMIVPIHVEGYFMAMELGVILFYFFFDLVAAVVWGVIFRIEFCLTNDICVILCAIIMIILGLVFMVQLNYLLGLLTLKYQGIGTFLMIKNNLMELVTGSIVPLALFPEVFLKLMKGLPFYYVTYLPSMLLTGKCEQEAVTGIVILGCWCVVIQVVISYVWNTYIRKYDGVGI